MKYSYWQRISSARRKRSTSSQSTISRSNYVPPLKSCHQSACAHPASDSQTSSSGHFSPLLSLFSPATVQLLLLQDTTNNNEGELVVMYSVALSRTIWYDDAYDDRRRKKNPPKEHFHISESQFSGHSEWELRSPTVVRIAFFYEPVIVRRRINWNLGLSYNWQEFASEKTGSMKK